MLKRGNRYTGFEFHLVGLAVTPDLELEILAEKVHAAHADTVEAPGNFVRICIKLSSRVKNGHYDLSCRAALLLVDVCGNAAAVIDNGNGIIHVDRDLDGVAVAGKGLVHRIVDDLVHQMM